MLKCITLAGRVLFARFACGKGEQVRASERTYFSVVVDRVAHPFAFRSVLTFDGIRLRSRHHFLGFPRLMLLTRIYPSLCSLAAKSHALCGVCR